eukprot:4379163-Pyramimonas_sp.AAC.1
MSLKRGRSEAAPVVTLAGRFGGEGGSPLFSAVRPLFGGEHVRGRPGGGQFCFHGLDKAKAAVLDEWMFIDEGPPCPSSSCGWRASWCPLLCPRTSALGTRYTWGPIHFFATCPETALAGLSSRVVAAPAGAGRRAAPAAEAVRIHGADSRAAGPEAVPALCLDRHERGS